MKNKNRKIKFLTPKSNGFYGFQTNFDIKSERNGDLEYLKIDGIVEISKTDRYSFTFKKGALFNDNKFFKRLAKKLNAKIIEN
jgi:hypothetical protein